MKKFFSLVLALVMALSLTTVAWGAVCTDPSTCAHEAAIGDEHYDTLLAALQAASAANKGVNPPASQTVKLIGDATATKLSGLNLDNVTLQGEPGNTFTGGFTTQGSNGNSHKNFKITGVNFVDASILITCSGDLTGFTVENCTFTGALNTGNYGAIHLFPSSQKGPYDDIVIKNNTFTNIASADFANCAIFMKMSNMTSHGDITIEGNTVDGCGNNAIQITNAKSTGTISINNNTMSGCEGSVVNLYGTYAETFNIVDNSIIAKVGGNDIIYISDEMDISGNYWGESDLNVRIHFDGSHNVTLNTYRTAADAEPVAVKAVFVEDGSYYKVQEPVAKIGDTYYATVDAAIAAAGASDVIVLLDTSAAIPAGYTVATDVNGNPVVLAGTNAPASGAKGAYYTTDLTNLAVYPSCDLTNYNYTLETYTVAADAAKTFAKVAIWQTHKVTGAKTIAYTAVVASADSANLAFVNGSSITYLNTAVNTWTATATKVATVDVEDAEKCGDVFVAGDVGVYTDANGKVFYETTTGAAAYNVDGKLVMLKEAAKAYPVVDSADLKAAKASPAVGTVYTVKHDYDVDVKTFNSDKTVTRVFCAECKGEFAFLEGTMAEAIQKFGAGNFALETIDNMPVYVAFATTSGTVSGATTGTVIESAETFDAGIAMYVGMSVMAAAGSAVILKKKD